MDHTTESKHYDIIIDDPLLTQYGFTKISFPLDDYAGEMILYNDKDPSMVTYVDFDKHNLDNTVYLLKDKLLSERKIDEEIAEGLCAYLRNVSISRIEDKDSEFNFFKTNGKTSRGKSTKESKQADDTKQDQDDSKKESSSDKDESTAQRALSLVEDQCHELFHDEFNTSYAAIQIGNHIEILPLKSSRFRNWLCRLYYDVAQDVLSSENATSVINLLKAKAEFEGTTRKLNLRVASIKEEPFTIYYDLTNEDGFVIKITKEGWGIQDAPIIFRRYSNQQPQVYPQKKYSLDAFDQFMNLVNIKGEDNKLLLRCYIISLFCPDIPKPVLMLHGEQGSAKSTLQELIRMLVDPSSITTVTFPRDINELIQKLAHNYICYFDNVSLIPIWISDQLCRAVTGSGFSKRELYTDDDDIIYNFKRCIGFNGINLGATKADLLDRGIIIELERIPREKRRRVEEIWAEFDRIKPELLGYIFDMLVKVLQVKSNGGIADEIKGLPRMADFAEIGEIISRCMGNEGNEFLTAYYRNIDLQIEEGIAANLVGNTILKFMENRSEWKGTATELLAELEEVASELKINTHDKSWPKAPNTLSRRINEVKTNLREIGIIIDNSGVRDSKTKVKTIEIRKISLLPLQSLPDENCAQIGGDNGNDIGEDGNDIDKVSLPNSCSK